MKVHGVMCNSVAGPASWNIHNTLALQHKAPKRVHGVYKENLVVVCSRVALAFFSPQLRH